MRSLNSLTPSPSPRSNASKCLSVGERSDGVRLTRCGGSRRGATPPLRDSPLLGEGLGVRLLRLLIRLLPDDDHLALEHRYVKSVLILYEHDVLPLKTCHCAPSHLGEETHLIAYFHTVFPFSPANLAKIRELYLYLHLKFQL